MSMMFDRIMVGGPREDLDVLRFGQPIVFNIQNVANYYFQYHDPFSELNFPNIAPPYSSMWMEFCLPPEKAEAKDRRTGVMIHSFDFLNGEGADIARKFGFSDIPEGVRWISMFHPFNEDPKWTFQSTTGCMAVLIYGNGDHDDEYGSTMTPFGSAFAEHLAQEKGIGVDEAKRALFRHVIEYSVFPCWLALSFLHCKNVHVSGENPPIKLSKSFQKKHKRALVRSHTLEIEPMKQVLHTEGQIEKVGLKRALHIARGHFKDYTKKGLFGREQTKGIYWWDAHVRGSKKEGIVLKDYTVNAPEPTDSPPDEPAAATRLKMTPPVDS